MGVKLTTLLYLVTKLKKCTELLSAEHKVLTLVSFWCIPVSVQGYATLRNNVVWKWGGECPNGVHCTGVWWDHLTCKITLELKKYTVRENIYWFRASQDTYMWLFRASQDTYMWLFRASQDAYMWLFRASQDTYMWLFRASQDTYMWLFRASQDTYMWLFRASQDTYMWLFPVQPQVLPSQLTP